MESLPFSTDLGYSLKKIGRLLTIEDMAEYLNISRNCVEECIEAGLIDAIQYGSQKRTTVEKLEKFINLLFEKEIEHETIRRFEPNREHRQRIIDKFAGELYGKQSSV